MAERPTGAALSSCCCCAAGEGVQGHLGTAHGCVWAGHKRGLCLRSPNPPPNFPLQGWAPVLSGRWKQRGCGEGCAGQMTPWGLWPGEGKHSLHNTSVGSVPRRCLWLFPDWLGSARQGHKRELSSKEKVQSDPGAQQPRRGKTQLLQPNRGVGSKVWSRSGLWSWCQSGAVGSETSGWGTGSLGAVWRSLAPTCLPAWES